MSTGAELHWCIADTTSDAMLGNVQIFRMGPVSEVRGRFQGEVGYWLRPGARGRGVVGEALRPVIAHAYTPVGEGGLGLIRLHAATDSDNHASQSILRSAGFVQCGADHKAWRRSDGSLSDGRYFELLAGELPADERPEAERPEVEGQGGRDDRAMARHALEPVTLEASPVQAGGAGIRLRHWRHTDADRVTEAGSDERTQYWSADILPSPYTLEHAHAYITRNGEQASQGEALCWCVADLESDHCLGSVVVHHLHDALGSGGEIGYWTHPDARGRGVMSQAVRLAIRHAFIPAQDGGLGRRRLQLNVATGNSASLHIALANGFVEVGRDRQAEPLGDGTFADLVRFDLLVDEWNTTALLT